MDSREALLFLGEGKPSLVIWSNHMGLVKFARDYFRMDIIDPEETVKLSKDSSFMKTYSRRGRKGGISDRGARVGKTERRSYQLGWGAHTTASCQPSQFKEISRERINGHLCAYDITH
ncbi:MAG: hypothetical protein AOA66_0477 [Candidatus Bathyarchaeota archaeon BA2]|nr:MAG: hypothetical protein AOA66_0477 [Candidatus Bathyarchaeota archaeon BA2]